MKLFNYIKIIGLHVLIGIAVYILPILSKVYLLGIFLFFVIKIIKTKPAERALQILIACGYIVGAEVFLRMTGGSLLYEASKYLVILFCLIGVLTIHINKQSIIYVFYIFLLLPGILIAGFNITENTTLRTAIAFNLSGPICLGIAALFCYKLKIKYQDTHKILLGVGLPLITITTYLFLYTPDIRDVVTGTYSNYATSGGFGPNQVATVLGFGMFIFTTRFFLKSPTLSYKIVNLILLALVSYRGVVTFSRGGMITGVIIIVAFLYSYYVKSSVKNKKRTLKLIVVFLAVSIFTWLFTSIQTGGFIDKRYANQDAAGRVKEDLSTGRNQLISFELEEFLKNPILGVGVGKIKELRQNKQGIEAASHNEMSRILSEHGTLGIFAFLILLIAPLGMRYKNRSNIFFFSCYIFWFLTINHSSMRITAPSFIYGLCLLHFVYQPSKNNTKKIKKV
ncbi:O-antigen ligase family protein [Pontimicrobium sp. MEBiC06410]